MSEVLYRKYRSQNFDELIGQEHITNLLKNAVLHDAISHAYLFVGSRGTGKTSTARILAKALNCTNLSKDGNPCTECDNCIAIQEGTLIDLIEIDAASNRGIDKIRELKERIEYAPAEGRYKIYIIDEVHMLTTEAFNALLKTLEEPPEHAIFMLATTDVHKLPATILSRCQRYDFRLGSEANIRAVLVKSALNEKIELSDEALDLLVQNANGSYRDALSLLEVVVSGSEKDDGGKIDANFIRDILGLPDSAMVSYLLQSIAEGSGSSAITMIEELESKGVNLQQFVKNVLEELRLLLLSNMKGEQVEEMPDIVNQLTRGELIKYIGVFVDVDRNLKLTTMPGLLIEVAVAKLLPDTHSSIGAQSSHTDAPASPTNTDPETQRVSESTTTKSKVTNQADQDDQTTNDAKSSKDKNVSKSDTTKVVNESDKIETALLSDVTNQKDAPKVSDATPEVSHEEEGSESVASDAVGSIEENWDEFLKAVKDENGPLYSFLKCAKYVGVDERDLHIEVPFEFHKDRIEDHKTREILAKVLKGLTGNEYRVVCEVNTEIQKKNKVSADVILSKIPQPSAAPAQDTGGSKPIDTSKSSGPTRKSEPEKAKIAKPNKKVEAIFAGM